MSCSTYFPCCFSRYNKGVQQEEEEPSNAIKVTVPAGEKVGVTFRHSSQIEVKSVRETSIAGNMGVEAGMIVESLVLEDGSMLTHMGRSEFQEKMKEHINSERVVKFVLSEKIEQVEAIPGETIEVTVLPDQSMGLKFKQSRPPKITTISDTSPFAESGLEEGMFVDTLILENGETYTDMETQEFIGVLKANKGSSRIVRFTKSIKSDESQPLYVSPVDVALVGIVPLDVVPEDVLVATLSAGQEMGLKFNFSKPPEVADISETSPLVEHGVEVGMFVDTLILENGEKHTDMHTFEFITLLKENKVSDRTLHFTKTANKGEIVPGGNVQEDSVEVKVLAGQKMGIRFKNSKPPEVMVVHYTSPFAELGVEAGMFVDTLILENGEEHTDMEARAFTTILKENNESTRIVRFTKHTKSEPEDVEPENVITEDNIIKITVMAGQQMGLKISKSKPLIVLAISDTSPFGEQGVEVGMSVDTLVLENGERHSDMSLAKFMITLRQNSHSNCFVHFTKTINSDAIISVDEEAKIEPQEDRNDLYLSEVDADASTVGESEIDADEISYDADASLRSIDVSVDADKTMWGDANSLDADKTMYTEFTHDADVSLASHREHWA